MMSNRFSRCVTGEETDRERNAEKDEGEPESDDVGQDCPGLNVATACSEVYDE